VHPAETSGTFIVTQESVRAPLDRFGLWMMDQIDGLDADNLLMAFRELSANELHIYYLQIAGLIGKLASEKVVAFQNVAYSGLEHVYNPFFKWVCVYSILANIFWCTLHSP
jgi:hypothetical protein